MTNVVSDVPDRSEALLESEPLLGHLATCFEGRPHVAPLWYVYRDGVVEIATTGTKLRNLQRNSRVALSVQKDVDGSPQWSVVVRGTASVIEDEAEAQATLRRINRKYGVDEDAWSENASVRIDVGSVSFTEY